MGLEKYNDYSDCTLKFEGEYLNNQKWIGTRCDKDDKVLYKLNNNINWEGKEYYLDGKIKFEGEYLNGQRRKGKEYDKYNKLIYEGEYLGRQKQGKGKEYQSDGKLCFEGEYLYDFKLKGKLYINEKLEYEGEFMNAHKAKLVKKWNGKGYDENGNVIYELINGNGKVKEYNEYGR